MSVRYSALLAVKHNTVYTVSQQIKNITKRRHKLTWFNIAIVGLLYITENKTQKHLAQEFGICETSIRNYIDLVTDALTTLLPDEYTNLETALATHDELLLDGSFFHKQNSYRKGFWSYKHRTCGVNVQFLTDMDGVPVWFSVALPGSVPDVTAAKLLDIAGAAAMCSVVVYADKGYTGLGENMLGEPVNSICTLSKIYRTTGEEVKTMNKIIAGLRWRAETAFARLKQYKILRHFRRALTKFDQTLKAVISLHHLELEF